MMKYIFNPGNYPPKINFALLILRVAIGIFMLTHGYGKLLKLFGDEPITFADPIGLGVTTSLFLAVFAEVLCSIFLIMGLFTRPAAIPLIITMLVAAFIVHADDEFRGKEMALLYFLVYTVIAITGAGKYSIDNLIYKKLKLNKSNENQ
jgi:putative oxidoreductase